MTPLESTPAATVLIVDDSSLIRHQVRRCLAAAGIAVIEAGDGIEALERLRATPAVALVVSDVHMPRMGGLDLLEEVRRTEATRDLPFLLLTTETEATLVQRARTLHFHGWLLKPFRPDLLVLAVQKLLGRAERGDSLSQRIAP